MSHVVLLLCVAIWYHSKTEKSFVLDSLRFYQAWKSQTNRPLHLPQLEWTTSHVFEYTGSSLYFAWKSGKNTNKKKWTVHGEHVSVIICKEDEWKRDSNGLIQHFGSLALWWQGNSIGWSTYLWCTSINNLYTCKWHATHCCKACVLWFDSYGSQTFYICCSLLNFDLSICLLF